MGRSFDLTRRRFMTLSASLPLAACAGTPQMSQPPSGQFITVSGKRLHYTMAGEGPPVILLHGASGNFLDWTFGRFDELAKTHKVLAFDRPGLGFSDAADDPSLSSQVALMVEAARQLGMERATVVGHSFGGAVALAWALDAPETVKDISNLCVQICPQIRHDIAPTRSRWHNSSPKSKPWSRVMASCPCRLS